MAVILGILIPSIFSIYNFIVKSNREVRARQDAIQQGYEFFEKLNIWLQNYTIDYEEYYNRQMVWCVDGWWTGADFKRNIWTWWYCTEFTAYGNRNSTSRSEGFYTIDTWYHDIYYCSSEKFQNKEAYPKVVKTDNCGKVWTQQSYWQYAALFTDVKEDTENSRWWNIVWDSDDVSLWSGMNNVKSIIDPENIQELYLISKDGKSRLFFRRKLVWTWWADGEFSKYTIQMLRLRGFDAWYQHNFDLTDKRWMYDGLVDTWACDYWMWFVGQWESVSGAYSDYKLPKDVDDCRIDIMHGPINVYTWNLAVYPVVDPELSWASQNDQINPYINFLAVFWIYVPYYNWRMADSIVDFKVPIQTSISMKDFYRD